LRQRSGNESFAQGAMQEIDGTEFAETATRNRKSRLKILDRAFSLSRRPAAMAITARTDVWNYSLLRSM
jgi:hypothetical protein